MKQVLLQTSLLSLLSLATLAQDAYTPLLNNTEWEIRLNDFGFVSCYTEKAVFAFSDLGYDYYTYGFNFYVREEIDSLGASTGKVWIRTLEDTIEVLLFDFSLELGDSIHLDFTPISPYAINAIYEVKEINYVSDAYALSGLRKWLTLGFVSSDYYGFPPPELSWAEGLGCTFNRPMYFNLATDPSFITNKIYQNDILLFDAGLTCNIPVDCSVPSYPNEFDITATSATIDWVGVSENPAASFSARYRIKSDPPNDWLTCWNYSSLCNLTSLTPASTYEWQVRKNCNSITSTDYTALREFTTQTIISVTSPQRVNSPFFIWGIHRQMTAQFTASDHRAMQLDIINLQGQQVSSYLIEPMNKSVQIFHFRIPNSLPSGVYIGVLKNEGSLFESCKFVVD